MSKENPKELVAQVVAKYTQNGWHAFPVAGSINDIIAQKDSKLHFVQVLTPETSAEPRFQGIPKNEFVQNATSNKAVPVHALVEHCVKRNGAHKWTIALENINTNSRMILRAPKKN
jgi:hypothetical protein